MPRDFYHCIRRVAKRRMLGFPIKEGVPCVSQMPNCLFTPPYHPELQPIEKLWRDV